MFYQNYKQYHYSEVDNDAGYNYNDKIMFPNSIAEVKIFQTQRLLILNSGSSFNSIWTTIRVQSHGKNPCFNWPSYAWGIPFHVRKLGFNILKVKMFSSKTVKDVLMDGYEDPLLSVAHSGVIEQFECNHQTLVFFRFSYHL